MSNSGQFLVSLPSTHNKVAHICWSAPLIATMKHSNFFQFKIPKGKKVNFKMLAKVYGQHMVFDYGDDAA